MVFPGDTPFMKTAVIAPIGLSPPVVTEFIDGIGEPVSDVVLFTTSHPQVVAGANLARAALRTKFSWIRVHLNMLPFDDIATSEQNFHFMKVASSVIRREREKHHCDKIFLNVAGGRKNMCITLSLISQIMATDGVFHVINSNVDIINQRLEQSRGIISRFAQSEDISDHLALYAEHRERLEPIVFPDRQSYEIIRIPTLPYPGDYLGYLIQGMRERGAGLTGEDKDLLVRHGLMDRIGNNYTLTPHGESFLEVIFQK